MPKTAASCLCEPFGRTEYAFRESKMGRIRKIFKPIWFTADLPLTFALLVWELASFLFPLTSLFRIHTMITQPRLHDINASLNAQGRIELKIPHGYRLRTVSSKHQLHSWCPWERQSGYTNSTLLWDREIHFLGQELKKKEKPVYNPMVLSQMLSPLQAQIWKQYNTIHQNMCMCICGWTHAKCSAKFWGTLT